MVDVVGVVVIVKSVAIVDCVTIVEGIAVVESVDSVDRVDRVDIVVVVVSVMFVVVLWAVVEFARETSAVLVDVGIVHVDSVKVGIEAVLVDDRDELLLLANTQSH